MNVNVNVGCRFDKQHLSEVQCHLLVIIDPQRRLRQAVRARLHFRIVHRPRHLPYQSSYQPAALRRVAHTLDGTRLALMELDRSYQVPVTRVWTRRSNTT